MCHSYNHSNQSTAMSTAVITVTTMAKIMLSHGYRHNHSSLCLLASAAVSVRVSLISSASSESCGWESHSWGYTHSRCGNNKQRSTKYCNNKKKLLKGPAWNFVLQSWLSEDEALDGWVAITFDRCACKYSLTCLKVILLWHVEIYRVSVLWTSFPPNVKLRYWEHDQCFHRHLWDDGHWLTEHIYSEMDAVWTQ